ncbi:MAG: hypothetical protein NTY07_08970 [Bacteroidia bacterium]|nr:hypothetical protein [Bacteroidia bacterium]
MRKSAIVLIALLFLINISFAQRDKRDVVYLKNGSVIRGQIINRLPSGQVQIKRGDNSYQVYESSQFDSIGKVNRIHPTYFNLTEAGILAGNSNNKYASQFSLMNISGWQFKNHFSLGAGAGVEFFSETYLPVVADFRYSFNLHKMNTFFGLQAGYSFAISKPDSAYMYYYDELSNSFGPPPGKYVEVKAKGGFLFNPFMGFCTAISKNLALTFNIGYRIMRLHYSKEYPYENFEFYSDNNRFSLKMGLILQ